MSCSEGVERGAATCVCKGQTVFEGVVIGQVFTGDVTLTLASGSSTERACQRISKSPFSSGRLASRFLIAWYLYVVLEHAEPALAMDVAVSLVLFGICIALGAPRVQGR